MALNPLVSLFGRFVARSARISGTGQTDRQTDRMTDRNPRCACAPRVVSIGMDIEIKFLPAINIERLALIFSFCCRYTSKSIIGICVWGGEIQALWCSII